MAETKKQFLDFGGLQILWGKMKSTFALKGDVEAVGSRLTTAEENITNLTKFPKFPVYFKISNKKS